MTTSPDADSQHGPYTVRDAMNVLSAMDGEIAAGGLDPAPKVTIGWDHTREWSAGYISLDPGDGRPLQTWRVVLLTEPLHCDCCGHRYVGDHVPGRPCPCFERDAWEGRA